METTNKKIAVLSIINKINNNYEGFSITDCFDRVYLYKKDFIPQYFNDKIIFISAKSFQQNHIILSKLIRNYTINLIKSEKEILCIGGESYIYGLCNDKTEIIYHYTNNINIYKDCEYNNKFYRKEIKNNYIDYNNKNLAIIPNIRVCLINLSTLTRNLINILNNNIYEKIIIISCHHDDFWKKIKNLTNYKLNKREYFICYILGYFITVNIFIKIK